MARGFLLGCFLLVGCSGWAQSMVVPTPATPAHQVYFLLGPTVLFADDGRTYFGADAAMGSWVSRRLAVGGTLSISGRRRIDTNYGYQATAPMVGLYSLQANTRLLLADAPRCRLDLLGGFGYGAVGLFDHDRVAAVVTRTRTGTTTSYQPLRVALSEHLLLEAGLGLTFKVSRSTWLVAQLSRRQLVGSPEFGAPDGFSHWVGTVGITMPNSW